MKRTLIAAALALSAFASSAAGITGYTLYDYDRNEGRPYSALHTGQVGLKLSTSLGSFDAAVLGTQAVTRTRDNSTGAEFGYSAGFNIKSLSVTGRAAVGQVDNAKYYSLGAEVAAPLSDKVSLFAGYKHTNSVSKEADVSNRYTVGADVNVTKKLAVRLGYARTAVVNMPRANGVTTGVSYAF